MDEQKPETVEQASTEPTEAQDIDPRHVITYGYFIAHDGTKMAYVLPKRKMLVIASLLAIAMVVEIIARLMHISLTPWTTFFVLGLMILTIFWRDKAARAGYYEVDEQGNPFKFVTASYGFTGGEKRMSKERFLRAVQGQDLFDLP